MEQVHRPGDESPIRKCIKCGTEKPLVDFYKTHKHYCNTCKACYNSKRNAKRRAQRAIGISRTRVRITSEAELAARKIAYRQWRERERLLSGKFEGDGPCWCCRNQAVGETPYRLCIICLG